MQPFARIRLSMTLQYALIRGYFLFQEGLTRAVTTFRGTGPELEDKLAKKA